MRTPALLLCGLLALAAAASTLALSQQPKEQRLDAGGYQVFTAQSGAGAPPVVFVAGLGEDTSTWDKVQPAASQLTHTFAYDRAGLGKSQPSSNPKTAAQMVKELHTVLAAAHVAPPYVLVGHSLGGAIVELYAHTYPSQTAGLVLVDPEDGRLLDRLQAALPKDEWDKREKMLAQMMSGATPGQKAELDGSRATGKELAAAFPLPNVPTVLLTGTLKDPSFPGNPLEQDLKMQIHEELLKANPNAEHVLAPNSRHYIQEDAPQLVIDAIRKVVEQCRTAAPKR
jgi:pimeloyl-ACP methyl ester carboxylesterase